MTYRVDLQELEFQLFDWLRVEDLLDADRFSDWDAESLRMVLAEAAELAINELASINAEGDREGVVWKDGTVTLPASVKKAWSKFLAGGWLGSTSNPEFGGLGMPEVVGAVVNDIFAGANLSFNLVTLLTRGASKLIESYGTETAKELFCERMISGEWTGTMCLTEPHAGSDVGASTTRAEPQPDGSYLIAGEKIFITSGEHDLTDNIIHAVLARVPGAPAGSRGLSLFAVPKIRVEEGGALGDDNDVYCAGVEHKLGIHASPTCSIVFGRSGACRGFLLGKEEEGMRLMFDMMNAARIEVGGQGVAVAAAAQQAALDYAHERIQMRHWDRSSSHGNAAVAIVEHPDVRRMLWTSSAYVQAMRSVVFKTALAHDLAHHDDDETRERYGARLALLTPACKAWPTDWGFRVTEWSLQVFGGYGYTQDYPAEQYLRDCKITSIYEGANGIQALDFVGRKLSMNGGATLREVLAEVHSSVEAGKQDAVLVGGAGQLGDALSAFEGVLADLPGREDGPLLTVLNAVPILDLFGALLGGSNLLEQALIARSALAETIAQRGLDAEDAEGVKALLGEHGRATFLHNKVQAAVHFCFRALPPAVSQLVAIGTGERAAIDAVF
jgi:hypothetical protein